MSSLRPDGFYWIRRTPIADPEIAEWRDEHFWGCGSEVEMDSYGNNPPLVISGRIKEPGTVLTADEVSRSCDLLARTSGFAIRLELTPLPKGKHG
jgi:hypothetical protein